MIWSRQDWIGMIMTGVIEGCPDLGVIFFIDIYGEYGSHLGCAILLAAIMAIALSIYLFKAPYLSK